MKTELLSQSLALIGDIMPLVTAKSKISPQKEVLENTSFHLIERPVLKLTKVNLSSLVWKIRHFKGQF